MFVRAVLQVQQGASIVTKNPTPPNVALLRALWSPVGGIWGLLKGSWGVLDIAVPHSEYSSVS